MSIKSVYRVGNSFAFTPLVPDRTKSCTGAYCASCDAYLSFFHQRCPQCGLPFVGPYGIPDLAEWKKLGEEKRRVLVKKVFEAVDARGRLEYGDISFIPLTEGELLRIEKMPDMRASFFFQIHRVSVSKIREVLYSNLGSLLS